MIFHPTNTQHLLCIKTVVFNSQMAQKGVIVEAERSVKKEDVRINIEEVEIKDLFIVNPFS